VPGVPVGRAARRPGRSDLHHDHGGTGDRHSWCRCCSQHGRNGRSCTGWVLGVLTEYGPGILIVSVLLVTASLAWRRALAAVPALAAGVLLYWGMYAQSSYPVMYLVLGLGFAAWIATYLWTGADIFLVRSRVLVSSVAAAGAGRRCVAGGSRSRLASRFRVPRRSGRP